ncbi:long-chain fatty acid--CoA ligase [Seongchinamella sediminis]|uniref:Long-chain fatty acid--CoA ligase n=1 Tax=Seongchinamella sediminis TaxID=2283635 RepID=A0A3L7E0X9_9GAMM|nr:class I adenylate-forming enzyme family protein [Seongchinamella sediminis]RLQ23438.1 long-chain fatty acid--CoA ligase [Seongchinamella sediminis]
MKKFDNTAPLLPEILALHGKWRGNRDAVLWQRERWSWAQFCAANHRFAHGLITAGVQPGDRVAIVMSNGLSMVQAIFGTMASGACSVPINLSVTDEALAGMLDDAGVVALVATADQLARIRALEDRLPQSLRLLVCDDMPAAGWSSIEQLCEGQPDTLPAVDIDPDGPLNVIYSSGTTGLPKGIMHTHRGRRDWAYDLAIALRYNGSARTLLTIGLYSNISWVAMLCTVLAGGTLVVHSRFDAADFLATVQAESVTHTAMVPIQFQRVIEQLKAEPADVSSMQAMMSCGSPLHESLKRAIFDCFPCGIIELYGLTEGIITTLEPEDAEGRWSSVGKPLLGTDICIVDDEDRVLGSKQSGEIVSRGRISMPGYWQREDATAEAEFIDASGVQWLRSGDIGYIDDEGYLYIVDRKKDMILSGGQNIYPQDIEAQLVSSQWVDDVAVIGLPSKRWGETPVALVVPVADQAVEPGALMAWANERLGRQQRLAEVILVDELPRNPNGKILKRELRKRYGDREYG